MSRPLDYSDDEDFDTDEQRERIAELIGGDADDD
jgi:hypothetical protein